MKRQRRLDRYSRADGIVRMEEEEKESFILPFYTRRVYLRVFFVPVADNLRS